MVNKALLQLPKSIVSFRLILATIILSLMGSFLMPQAVSGWSDNMLNSAALDIGRLSCSGVPTGDSEIRRYLQAIPNNATPSQIGIPSSRISNLGLDSSRPLRDQYMNEGATDIFQHCDVNSAVIQHGMTLIDGSDSNEITDFRSQLRLAVNPHREAWINDVCDTEDAPLLTCRDDASKKIDDMITACSSALSSSSAATIPSINNVGDLERCAGESNAFQAIQEQREQQECEQDGGTFEDGACVGGDDDSPATCVIEHGLGWVLCPIMNTLAAINDGAWWALERFLVSPTMTRDDNSGYNVWAMMRNIANVLFVLFFMAIVYSQITSVGISNYGIKKLLPKLIVGAILVNTSWWIVAGAVDLSNVLGSSLYSIGGNLADASNEPIEGSGDGGTPNWQYAVGGLLMGTIGAIALVMAGLTVALPLLLGGIIFVGGLVIALVFRNAMVIILAILAPIAFVAYMLPGTNGFFKTWYTLFKAVLLLYPAAAIAMGMSKVAATVTWNKAQGDNDWIMMFVAAAMPAMGIIMALMVAKTMGSVMSKFGVTNPLGGAIDASKKWAKERGESGDRRLSNRMSSGKLGKFAGGRFGAVGQGRRDRSKFKNDMRTQAQMNTMQAQMYGNNAVAGPNGLNAQLGASAQQLNIAKTKAEIDELEYNDKLHVDAEIQKLGLEASRQQLGDDVATEVRDNDDSAKIAGGSMEGGKERAQHFAHARLDKRQDELIAHQIAAMQNKYGSEHLLSGAKSEFENATRSGDVVRARAATQILGTKTGGAGIKALEKLVSNNEQAALNGQLSTKQQEGISATTSAIKADVSSMGLKGKNRPLEQWSISTKSLESHQQRPDLTVGLNEAEIAGQHVDTITAWVASGQITQAQAKDVMNAHDNGLHLDSDKKAAFERAAAGMGHGVQGPIPNPNP